jgi:hypothetical protein
MDIFPDWLGETGGVPYPVLVQGLDLTVAAESLEITVEDVDVSLTVALDVPLLTMEVGGTIDVTVQTDALDLEVDGD